MKSVPPAPADPLNLLRQQLILSQVRIMELEDVRDDLAPKLAEMETLLAAAQTLADQKTDEAAHLARLRTDLQTQYDHMRHMQHVTNEALNATRTQLAAAEQTVSANRLVHEGLLVEIGHANDQLAANQAQCAALGHQLTQANDQLASLNEQLRVCVAETAAKQQRIGQLDAEQRAMKASRSWRWTAWLRSIERKFRGR
jgi:chromosome segregation ATPase